MGGIFPMEGVLVGSDVLECAIKVHVRVKERTARCGGG